MKIFKPVKLPEHHPFLINKYTNWYFSIIYHARSKDLQTGYYETHHIIPDCFYINNRSKGKNPGWLIGDSNSRDNKIKLTADEHFICHWLLTKMTNSEAYRKMEIALMYFRRRGKQIVWSAGKYKRLKMAQSNANKGMIRTEKEKDHLRKINLGKKQSPETISKRVESRKGYTHSEETKRKIRLKNLGKKCSESKLEKLRRYKISDKNRELLRKRNTGKKQSQNTIQKRVQSRTGYRHSEETKRKMRESKKSKTAI